MIDKVRTLNQEDWKRTQIRMPQEQSDSAVNVNDQSISKIADKIVELLKKAP